MAGKFIQGPVRTGVFLLMAGTALTGCERVLETEGLDPVDFPVAVPQVPETPVPLDFIPVEGMDGAAAGRPQKRIETRIRRGEASERLLAATLRGQPSGTRPPGDIVINLNGDDVQAAAQQILGDVLGLNYVLDPGVQGQITLRTTRALNREEVLPTFEAALRTVGATMVRRGDLIAVVPAGSTPRQGISVGGETGYQVRVLSLRNASAADVARTIEPVTGDLVTVTVDEARNFLMLGGARSDVAQAEDLARLFDADWMSTMTIALLPLEFVDARNAVVELTDILNLDGAGRSGLTRLVPIGRLNAIVAITPTDRQLTEIRRMVSWLDQNAGESESRLFVYFVQNTRAEQLAASLNDILGIEVAEATEREEDPFAALNSTIEPIEPIGLGEDVSVDVDVDAPQAPLVPAAPQRLGGQSGEGIDLAGIGESPIRIAAEEQRNALLISASPRDYRRIQSAIQQLDVAPLQVSLDVTIVEVTLNDNLRYGLQWFFRAGDNEFTLSRGGGSVSPTFPGFSYAFTSENLQVALDALSDLTDVRIVSSPTLMVLNNESATLQVGDQVPIAVQSVVAVQDPGAPIVNSIQFRDTGVLLNVTPRVNNSGLVILDIEQEVSSVARTMTSGIDSPTIQQRRVASTVAVGDGEMLALGGLISGRRSIGRSGVPLLSDIPFIGSAFRSTTDDKNQTELLVLVQPKVIRSATDLRAVTTELRERLSRARPVQRLN